jgi:signal transduction histidine kinase
VRFDLRAHLALQIAIGVAAVAILVLLLRAYIVQEEVLRVGRGRLTTAQVLANYVDAQLTDHLQQIARTAARMQTDAPPNTALLLDDLRSRLSTAAYGVFLLDASGRTIAADPPAMDRLGSALVERPEVAEALAAGRTVVSAVHHGPGGRAQFGMLVPVRANWLAGSGTSGPPGALGVLIDPTNPRFADLVEAAQTIGGGTSGEVVDQFGTVVIASQRERTLLPGQHPDFYRTQLAARAPATHRGDDSGNDPQLVVFAPLQRAPWGLALAGPEAEVLAPIRRWDPALITLVLASFGVLLGLAIHTARGILNPIRALIAAARRIAQGDLASAVPTGGGAELRELADALEEMRRDLRAAEIQRGELDRLKDQFVSSISHELRTPLGYIKGYTTTLLRKDTHWNDSEVEEFLTIVDQSTDDLAHLVDHLLDISRIAEGALRIDATAVDLGAAAREVAQRAQTRSKLHTIEVNCAPGLPRALVDRGRLLQVLGNLVDNATKYSPEGGRVTISAEFVDGMLRMSVQDQGLGIAADQLQAVFDRFHRGADPRIRTIRGTGLGLPICRGIVEAHGGEIWAEQAPIRGTIFLFTLPRAPSPTLASSTVRIAAAAAAAAPRTPRRSVTS